MVTRALIQLVRGDEEAAEESLRERLTEPSRAALEAEVQQLAREFLQADDRELARDLFALNTRLFPESRDAWLPLAEVQLHQGDREAAIASLERCLELDPGSEKARALRRELGN